MYVRELAKVNTHAWHDVNESGYRNGGHGFKLHTNEWELAIYDKLKDLAQAGISEGRAFEDDSYVQLGLFDDRPVPRQFQVLRIEARYNSRTKLKSLCKAIGEEPGSLTFDRLFSRSIAQKALAFEVARLKKRYPPAPSVASMTAAQFLTELRISNPGRSIGQLVQAVGYEILMRELGARDVRMIGAERPRDWSKFQYQLRAIKPGAPLTSPFDLLEQAITESKTLRLADYEGQKDKKKGGV